MHEQVSQTLVASTAVAEFPPLHLTPMTTYIVSYGHLTKEAKGCVCVGLAC